MTIGKHLHYLAIHFTVSEITIHEEYENTSPVYSAHAATDSHPHFHCYKSVGTAIDHCDTHNLIHSRERNLYVRALAWFTLKYDGPIQHFYIVLHNV